MKEISTNKPPISFWIISILAFIWNIMGVLAYIGQAYMTEEDLAVLPEAEQALYTNVPAWATAAFAVGVFAGTLGCLFLILRKKWAKNLFFLSFVGVIVQMVYNLFISKAMEVYGPGGAIMPIMILIIAVFLIWYTNKSIYKNWIS